MKAALVGLLSIAALFSNSLIAAELELNITGRIHFNVNVSDFERSRAFYTALGFIDSVGDFPETNTRELAQAVGFDSPYRLHAELIYLGTLPDEAIDLTVPTGRFIDLIEWLEPRRLEPPYSNINHLGISHFALATSDLDAAIAHLQSRGSELLSAATRRADGGRFVIARDPDGTFVELIEDSSTSVVGNGPAFVTRVAHVGINVSNLERSRAFYQMLGFKPAASLLPTESLAVANAIGFDEPYAIRGEILVHEADGSVIELVEWQQPRDLAPAYSLPINHLGIHRMNWATSDINADVATLKAQGVKFLSPVAPCCTGDTSTFGIVVFEDPDGVYNQLMGNLK